MGIITMIILAVIAIIILVIGILAKKELASAPLCIIGGLGLLVLGIGGFGAHASTSKNTMIVTEIRPDTLIKTNKQVVVEFENTNLYYDKIEDYMNINDSTVFYEVEYFNYYGIDLDYNSDYRNYITYDKKFANIKFGEKIEAIEP